MKRPILLLASLLLMHTVFAIDYTWTGGGGAVNINWNNPANWGGAGFPNGPGDRAFFTNPTIFRNVTVNVAVVGEITMTAAGNPVVTQGAPFTVTGNLNISGGTFNNGAALIVAGLTTVNTPGRNLTLNNAGNDFASVDATSVRNLRLADANDIVFVQANATGLVVVTAVGAITSNGILSVTGTATLTAGTSITGNGNVTLSNTAALTAGTDIDLFAGANNFANTVSAAAGGHLSLSDNAGGVTLGACTVGGYCRIESVGSISSAAAIRVAGLAQFRCSGGGSTISLSGLDVSGTIELDTTGAGGNATIVNAHAVILTGTSVSGALNVTATTDDLSDAGPLVIGSGLFRASLAGANVTLAGLNTGGTTPTVSAFTSGAGSVSLTATNAIDLGTVTAGADLSVTAGGDITESGALTVPGTAAFSAGANNITLNRAANNIPTTRITSAANVTLASGNPVSLATTGPLSGLDVSASPCTLANDLDVNGNVRISGGTLDVDSIANRTINVAGDWTNGGTFLCQTGEVIFDGPATTITGATTFYRFTCAVPGKTIFFTAGSSTAIARSGVFAIAGAAANWIHLRSTAAPVRWGFTLSPGASLAMQYVFVHNSNAVNPVVTPPNVDASDNCVNWLTGLTVSASYTEDSDADGRIDRLRVTAGAAVDDNFAGLTATLTGGYRVDAAVGTNGYSTGANPAAPLGSEVSDNTFYVWLVEQADLDTAVTPGLVIRTNTSLSDGASPAPTLLAAGAAVYPSSDRAAPVIGFTLARAGTSQVYLRVSEPLVVFGGGPILPANFTFGALNPQSVASPGSGEYLLNWNPATTTFTAAQIINGNTVTCLNLADAANNRLQGAASVARRVSDLALGVPGREPINPVLLFDGTAREPGPEGVGYITAFDGSGWIQDYPDQPNATPSLQANFGAGLAAVRLWWDTNVPAALRKNGLWLPPGSLTYGLVPAGNPGVSAINGLNDAGPPPSAAFAFDVNAEPELVTETLVEFFIEFSGTGIFAARLERPTAVDWYRSVEPWSFGLHKPGGQKGNVNVFNNVINPNNGELAKLHYQLSRAGAVTIQVFGLSGDLVTVLYRGTLGTGDHSTAWNGRTQSGRIVARGLYFIRIVGPDVDETRKILVVK